MADNTNKIQPLAIPLAFGINSPATYINAMSWQEAISIFMFKLNECVKLCNDMDEFNKAVRKELEEFHKTVSARVKIELQEMYDNGELTELLEIITEPFFNVLKQQTLNTINQLVTSYEQSTKTLHLTRGGDFEWQR